MQRAIVIIFLFLSFGLKAQVYQAMPQAGYGPVKRFLTDSVLTIPTGINSLRNITGGRDAGQIRWNTTDSGFYVYSGYQWIKINIDSVSLSNRINGKLSISDTATMLSAYMRKTDTLSLSNRIDLRVKYSDTASMLSVYLRKLDTASLSDRINTKQDPITLTTTGISGVSTFISNTLNIPNYGGALTAYVPYSGATTDVTLGARNLTGTLLNADYSLQVKNGVGAGGSSTVGYTSISSDNSAFYFHTNYTNGYKGAYFVYPTNGTTFLYNLPVRAGTIALVEDTVSLSNRINAKIGATDTVSLSNRINLKLNISDTASMLLPYLRKGDTTSLSNRIDLKLNAADTASLSNRINLKLNISDTASMLSNYQSAINARVKYTDTAAMLDPYLTAAVTSVGLSMPVAFSVANSPITSTGTLAVSAIGTAAQYIRGDGQLATLPSGASGGSSVNYYLNGGTSQGTIGGSTYYEMSKDVVIGTGVDFSRTNAQGNGLISQFITDAGDPNRTEIPAGAWNFELFFNASSNGGSPSYYIELLKYNGTTFTSIASGSAIPELITSGTTIDLYLTSLAVPYTTLSVTDRLVIRVYVVTSGRTITLHTQDGHLCLITTSFAGGVSSLNGLTANTQYLAVGTSGTDFAINSLVDTHTFNLPTASATNRGALSSADWTTFNGKMNYSDTVSLSNRINTKLNSADTASLSNRINAKADALSGTTNTVPKFTSSTTIGNSNIKDDGNIVTINATAGSFGALQVGNYNGNILLNTTNTSAGLIFQNTSASNKKWDFSSYNNDLSFNESNVNPVMTLQAGGNVGINVTNPSNKLEVNGTFKSVGIATFGSTLSDGTYTYTLPSATGTLALTSAFDTSSLSNRINTKLNSVDTASLSNRINAKGSGTVTSIATNLGLTGGTITTSGTLSVDTSSASILSRQRAANTYYLASNPSGYTTNTGTVTSIATGLGLSGGTITTSGTLLVDTSSASILSRQRAAATYATTSSLGGYLPLSGGTLTGALGGTSATFSGAVQSIGVLTSGNVGATTGQFIIESGANASSRRWKLLTSQNVNGDFIIQQSTTQTGSTFADILGFNATGAATFSSNVGIGSISSSWQSAYFIPLEIGNSSSRAYLYGRTDATIEGGLGINSYYNSGWKYTNTGPANLLLIDGGWTFRNAASGTAGAALTWTDVMKITSSGNVGIGTTSPQAKLHILNSSVGGSYYGQLTVEQSGEAAIQIKGSDYSSIYFSDAAAPYEAGIVYDHSLNTLALRGSGNTADLTITSGGNVLIGTNSTTGIATGSSVNVGITLGGGVISSQVNNNSNQYWSKATGYTSGDYTAHFVNNSYVGGISTNGSTTNYAVASDYRLKQDFKDFGGIDLVNKIKTYDYEWKGDKTRMYGVIAHELQEVIPYAVIGIKDAERMQGVDYSKIVPILIKGMQEQQLQIKELQTKIQTLENK